MAKAEIHDKMRIKIGFDINQFSSPGNVSLFLYDSTTPTKIPGSTRYMVVVDVPMYETVAPDITIKELAMVAEDAEDLLIKE